MKKYLFIYALIVISTVSCFSQDSTKVRFSGLVYLDYNYNVARGDTLESKTQKYLAPMVNGPKDLYGFFFRRIFFTADYDISNRFMARFRLEADQQALASNGTISTKVKDAFIMYKNIFQGTDLQLGLQTTIGYEVSEAHWSFRSLERTELDIRGLLSSRDMGISLRGKLDDKGDYNYAVQYGDASADKPETDKFKRLSAIIHIKPFKNFQATFYGEQNWAASNQNMNTFSIFAGYQEKDKFSIGAEGFYNSKANTFITPAKDTTAQKGIGYSIFGYWYFLPELGLIGRFDKFNPNTDAASTYGSIQYIIVALDWKLDKCFSVIPNIQLESYNDVKVNNAVKDYKPSMNARITFVYKY